MDNALNILTLISVIISSLSLVFVLYLFLKNQKKEKQEFNKAEEIKFNDKRLQLEEDLYRANDRLVESLTGFDIYQNIDYSYNEKFRDISLTDNVLDTSFFEKMGLDLEKMSVEKNHVTCLMPFHPSFDRIYNRIRRATKLTEFKCHRSDEEYKSGDIMRYTIELILKSQIVIGVLDGRNPNVFYEVGIAHSVGKTVILVAEDKTQIPFDLHQHRFILYKSLNDLEEKLVSALKSVRENE